MSSHFLLGMCCLAAVSSCGPPTYLRMSDGSNWHAYAQSRDGGPPSGDLDGIRFKDGLCQGQSMLPERETLKEAALVEFLRQQNLDVRLERPRADLVYAVVNGAGTTAPIRLRIAILKDADEAGLELHEALLEHGQGAWGVHRSNLAVLGPAGDFSDDIVFAAKTKLACWGVFTIAGRDDTFVVPGAYLEI